ncbi:MAG: hypothetical protein ABI332_12060 [Polyangiaceae bacterium]
MRDVMLPRVAGVEPRKGDTLFVMSYLPPQPPGPPRSEEENEVEPQALRADHYDHDLRYARAMIPELAPRKQEQVTIPRWMVIFLMLLVVAFILSFADRIFSALGK